VANKKQTVRKAGGGDPLTKGRTGELMNRHGFGSLLLLSGHSEEPQKTATPSGPERGAGDGGPGIKSHQTLKSGAVRRFWTLPHKRGGKKKRPSY